MRPREIRRWTSNASAAPLAPGLADFDHHGAARDAQPDVGADKTGPIFSDGFESSNVSAWSIAL